MRTEICDAIGGEEDFCKCAKAFMIGSRGAEKRWLQEIILVIRDGASFIIEVQERHIIRCCKCGPIVSCSSQAAESGGCHI